MGVNIIDGLSNIFLFIICGVIIIYIYQVWEEFKQLINEVLNISKK